jgi:glycosyltransferase involved in cell wall biosynthesis
MQKAKVAVVFPVYNGEKTLKESLQCIADQDFVNFQAFILENGCTDRSR